jgi:hypothetical protein
MSRIRLFIAVAALAFAAQSAFAQFGFPIQNNGVIWRNYASGITSRVAKQQLVVLETQGDLDRYWLNVMGRKPETSPRDIDWSKEKLVAIHAGARPSGGYTITVQNVIRVSPTVARIVATEWTPMQRQFVTQAVTSPWTLIRVDRGPFELDLDLRQKQGPPPGTTIIGSPERGRRCHCDNCACGCGCGD